MQIQSPRPMRRLGAKTIALLCSPSSAQFTAAGSSLCWGEEKPFSFAQGCFCCLTISWGGGALHLLQGVTFSYLSPRRKLFFLICTKVPCRLEVFPNWSKSFGVFWDTADCTRPWRMWLTRSCIPWRKSSEISCCFRNCLENPVTWKPRMFGTCFHRAGPVMMTRSPDSVKGSPLHHNHSSPALLFLLSPCSQHAASHNRGNLQLDKVLEEGRSKLPVEGKKITGCILWIKQSLPLTGTFEM